MEPLVLIANPGSASRKYALYQGSRLRADIHFEYDNGQIVYSVRTGGQEASFATDLSDLRSTASKVTEILHAKAGLRSDETVSRIGLRIVAPGEYFIHNRVVDNTFVQHLQTALFRAPLHVGAALDELHALRVEFPQVLIAGISDSAFHATKRDAAWLYGLPLDDADRLDIKRYGYHGLSVESVVTTLTRHNLLPQKTIVAHIGSGISITALENGVSIDTTMGYSPLEGVVMATRSGSLDITAAGVLRTELGLDEKAFEGYLNSRGGLLGLGGSSDVRELVGREAHGDHRARLALDVYVYNLQKAIGQMAAVLDGADALVFTGTVGLRSTAIRERVTSRLGYLGFSLDIDRNESPINDQQPTNIASQGSNPVYVIETDEQAIMAAKTLQTSA